MTLLDTLFIPVALIYLMVVAALFVYGINFYYLAWHAWRRRGALVEKPSQIHSGTLPPVTVQLPIYNEWYVAERLIAAAASLDYPRDLLEIQVLDDSTDDTFAIAARTVDLVKQKGINIHHLHRTERHGYKAGALADGLKTATGEFIAIFDADFVPDSDFLKRILPYFDGERVAFVQARWGHLNREYSFFTFLQSLSIDAHFAVEQLARSYLGFWFNFNGTAGVWRKEAILDAGGWKAETLTEDLDLSYRAFLRGWSARYAGDVEVRAELPVSFTAYRRQQHRWARGSFECALRYVPLIWNSNASLARKIQSSLHLTGYSVHILLFLMVLLYPAVLLISMRYPNLVSLFGIAAIFNFTALAPSIFFAIAQYSLRKRWITVLPAIFFMTVLGGGMMVNTLRAALQVWVGKPSVFERTPKYGIVHRSQRWGASRYFVESDMLIAFELLLAVFNVWTAWLGWQTGNWLIVLYAMLFAAGLFFVAGFTILQTIHHRLFPKPEVDPVQ